MDTKSMQAFLQYHIPDIDNDWVIGTLVTNIIAFCAGAFFSDYKIMNGCVVGVLCIGLIIFYRRITRRRKKTVDFLLLLTGIYWTLLSISLNYLAFMLLKRALGHPVLLFFILFLSTAAVGIAIWSMLYQRMKSQKYTGKEAAVSTGIMASAAGVGVVLSRLVRNSLTPNDDFLISGVLIALLGMLAPTGIYFIMRYYCYQQLRKAKKKSPEES